MECPRNRQPIQSSAALYLPAAKAFARRDKATMEFHGQTLLDHMVRLLSTVASPVRIVSRKDLPSSWPPVNDISQRHPPDDWLLL
jgi:molybdopterin-guanine dinucleotide biosynthesis protein A